MITYGKYQIDPAALPAKNVLALLSRGVSHYLGNEVSARVIAALRGEAKAKLVANGTAKPSDAEIAALVDAVSEDDYQAIKSRLTDEAFARLMSGEVGAGRVAGPSVTPLEKAILAEAKARAVSRLKSNGLKVPKGEDTVMIGGKAKTFDDIVNSILDRETSESITVRGVTWEPIEKVAKRHIAEQQKRNDASKKMAEARAEGEEIEGL